MEDKSGNLWVGTNRGGLNKISLTVKPDFNAYSFTHFNGLENQVDVFSFAEGRGNRIWVGSTMGIHLLDKTTKEILQHIPVGDAQKNGVASLPMSLYETPNGYLLIGTGRAGMNIWDMERQRMEYYPKNSDPVKGLGTDMIRSIHPVSNESNMYMLAGGYVHI